MKLKHLEALLSQVEGFETPKWALEQYATPVHFASRMLQVAADRGDVEECGVLDLGCGTGMLSIAAALLGAHSVTGVDADDDALAIARRNVTAVVGEEEETAVEFIQADVTKLHEVMRQGQVFDTVVMNPPFGTKTQGADMAFLHAALQLAPVVYSLHKSSTREFLVGKGASSLGAEAEVLAELRYDLANTYKFHKKKSVNIEVDLLRFHRHTDQEASPDEEEEASLDEEEEEEEED